MGTKAHETPQLGDLVVVAFDEAAKYSSDPREISHLATTAVTHSLRHAWNRAPSGQGRHRTLVRAPLKLQALPRPSSSSEIDG